MLPEYGIDVEWDERGCWLVLKYQEIEARWPIDEPEQLYDRVKAAILPWLMERDEAVREYRLMGAAVEADMREAYDASDPKSEGYHDRMSTIYDNREGK